MIAETRKSASDVLNWIVDFGKLFTVKKLKWASITTVRQSRIWSRFFNIQLLKEGEVHSYDDNIYEKIEVFCLGTWYFWYLILSKVQKKKKTGH